MDFAASLGRVRRLLLSPATEWDAIAAEPADVRKIYLTHVAPLVIAATMATALGMSLVGVHLAPDGTFKYPAASALSSAAVAAALSFVMVYVLAIVINVLAKTFKGTPDLGQALKLSAYAPTAVWVAGLLYIVPDVGNLPLLGGAYSLYLLFVGLPKLMKPVEDKAAAYAIVVGIVMIVAALVIASASNAMLPSMTPVWRVN
jgi:subtilisin family serine protease